MERIWRTDSRGAKPQDVIEIPVTCNGMDEKTPHPSRKPEALLRNIIPASSQAGDLVIDPFPGSGTTAVAAGQLERTSWNGPVGAEMERGRPFTGVWSMGG